MEHKAIDETQTVVYDREDSVTEECIWDFLDIRDIYTEGKNRLLIVGDSITGGINSVIRDVINSAWIVDSYTTSLPINDRDFLPNLENALLQSGKSYDVIHFNNGGHGHESPAVFEKSYREVIALMKKLHPNAKIVLATSVATYVPEPDGTFVRRLERWHRFTDPRNEICRKLVDEYELCLNDLGSYSPKIKDDHSPDGIHYNKEGSRKLAFQVIKFAR